MHAPIPALVARLPPRAPRQITKRTHRTNSSTRRQPIPLPLHPHFIPNSPPIATPFHPQFTSLQHPHFSPIPPHSLPTSPHSPAHLSTSLAPPRPLWYHFPPPTTRIDKPS